MERSPSWSPDGKSVAYFSDESGEYALHIRDQAGQGPVRRIALGEPPSFFYRPVWSPDGKKIAYNDKRLTLWYVDLAKGVPVKVDTTYYYNPAFTFDFEWSPDSRWLTFGKQVPSHMGVICVYSLETGQVSQVTDGMSDAKYPAFDRSGKYLFFTASTDVGLTPGWLNMSSMDRPVTRSVYVAVLRKDLPSPLAPESDGLLERLASAAQSCPGVAVEVAGFTDSTGSDIYNQALSEGRAAQVVKRLVRLGVDPARLAAAGYGEAQPVAANDTSEGRALNRRIEFKAQP